MAFGGIINFMNTDEIEEWRPVNTDGGIWHGLYEVSSLGRVRSLDREVSSKGLRKRILNGRILKQTVHPSGYLVVGLAKDGLLKQRLVHRLVASAFLGLAPSPSHEAAHNDGDRTNPALNNIRWATKKENAADKRLHGTNNEGSFNGRTSLSESDVKAIVARVEELGCQKTAAKEFGLPVATLNHIMTGRTWGSVTGRTFSKSHVTVTPDLVARMKNLKAAGLSIEAIASEIGVGSATVFRNYKRDIEPA